MLLQPQCSLSKSYFHFILQHFLSIFSLKHSQYGNGFAERLSTISSSTLYSRGQGTVVMSRRKNLQTLRGMNNEPRRCKVPVPGWAVIHPHLRLLVTIMSHSLYLHFWHRQLMARFAAMVPGWIFLPATWCPAMSVRPPAPRPLKAACSGCLPRFFFSHREYQKPLHTIAYPLQ